MEAGNVPAPRLGASVSSERRYPERRKWIFHGIPIWDSSFSPLFRASHTWLRLKTAFLHRALQLVFWNFFDSYALRRWGDIHANKAWVKPVQEGFTAGYAGTLYSVAERFSEFSAAQSLKLPTPPTTVRWDIFAGAVVTVSYLMPENNGGQSRRERNLGPDFPTRHTNSQQKCLQNRHIRPIRHAIDTVKTPEENVM